MKAVLSTKGKRPVNTTDACFETTCYYDGVTVFGIWMAETLTCISILRERLEGQTEDGRGLEGDCGQAEERLGHC
jgi:hypothetical protein